MERAGEIFVDPGNDMNHWLMKKAFSANSYSDTLAIVNAFRNWARMEGVRRTDGTEPKSSQMARLAPTDRDVKRIGPYEMTYLSPATLTKIDTEVFNLYMEMSNYEQTHIMSAGHYTFLATSELENWEVGFLHACITIFKNSYATDM